MIKLIKKLIFPTLLLLIVLAFYLLDKDIKKYSQIIEEHEVIMLSHQNIFLFQGSRLRDLDIRVGKLLTRTYARYE